jgi:plastocyanin
MRLRRGLLLGVVALLGAAVVVLPALAVEANPTIQAQNVTEGATTRHFWAPAAESIEPGGTVALSNPSATTPHGVEWVSTPGGVQPTCTGVPVGTTVAASGTNWSGSCSFANAGVYTFYCTVHGPEMTGRITVGSDGVTTTTMTTGSTTQTQGSTPSPSVGASGPAPGAPAPGAGSSASLLAGSASSALRLASTQHGHSVKGSLAVSQAGAGGTLAVTLLARSAALASAGHRQVQVGRTLRSSLRLGTTTFTVALSAKAKRALRLRGRLALTVRLVLTSPHGSSVTLTRAVVVRR